MALIPRHLSAFVAEDADGYDEVAAVEIVAVEALNFGVVDLIEVQDPETVDYLIFRFIVILRG